MFIINETDYSGHVIAGSYAVNSEPMTSDWVDANGVTHKQKLRDKVKGTFDMWFRNIDDYNDFIEDIDDNTATNLTIPLTVEVNNTGESHTGNFFLKHTPTRNIDGAWADYMERFTVTIEEA